jgi:hypothetical protein
MIVSERDSPCAREAAAKVNSTHLSSKFFALVVPPFQKATSILHDRPKKPFQRTASDT